ncbi:MAG: alanine--tRNA ligase [Patescibacteria group bacterium]|jgi:alanyl-tRNA synthetase
MTYGELRRKFIEFYQARGHQEIGQAPLVPERDTSVLFTTAGMHPLIPYLLGEKHPDGTRLVNVQRSIRTTDIDEVGDATHATMFEMLGHWSLGDYWKREAITWSYEFVTTVLGFAPERLAVTVFRGDTVRGIGLDEEAKQIWQELGVQRIAALGDDNFWGPVHSTGPCGPTTEIFAYVGEGLPGPDSLPGGAYDHEWVEIWNNVFMEYVKTAEGAYVPLEQRNIDTGVGLERVLMTTNGHSSIYETDTYRPLVAAIASTQGAADDRRVRILADHAKAAVFLIADGVLPGNKDRGYILRRLIRRAVQAARSLGFSKWEQLVEAVVGVYAPYYPHLADLPIYATFVREQKQFEQQLGRAARFVRKELARRSSGLDDAAAAELAFLAYQSHALPIELAYELLVEQGVQLDRAAFGRELAARNDLHRAVSGAGAEKKFGGHGLILDTGELKAEDETELQRVLRLHTATHLLQAALRAVLGSHVQQKGSDINAERLRFDFTHGEKLTDDERSRVEDWVNDAIARDLPMQHVELSLDEAKASGALHFFSHKYPEQVKVYFAGHSLNEAISKEFCGGPHIDRTGAIGQFRILKEQSAAAGVRRIKATVA